MDSHFHSFAKSSKGMIKKSVGHIGLVATQLEHQMFIPSLCLSERFAQGQAVTMIMVTRLTAIV